MTTIALGGGPDLHQRREFAGLRDGTHVPGYRGYCPQIKYRVGKTYGTDTHQLSEKTDHVHPLPPVGPSNPKPVLSNKLPAATGDNKYTEQMVPGYTGYIPRSPFKFGNTYKEDCDFNIDQHMSMYKYHDYKTKELQNHVRTAPQLQPIEADPHVKNVLDKYRDTHPIRPILLAEKRLPTEPPMPGYKGFIPRINVTEKGLGARYHTATKEGLEAFAHENAGHWTALSAKVDLTRNYDGVKAPSYSRRVYLNDGMIPKYTGYLPQRRFAFGNTYGDTSRSLSVCKHKDECFGDFMRSKTMPVMQSSKF
ncbi:C10orf82 [Bugula neritina]|uniref:C10orf82 n=1 Tax=Bugula neritina TaxID=10212 RepID=A0A7J7JER7_BUGNE|nr:C10orf82 [Bugula neritina]